MEKKSYKHTYAGAKDAQVSFRCSKAQKHKFDEVVTYLHKSKTEIMVSYVEELYKKMIER